MAVILRYFTEFGSFGAAYLKVIEYTVCNKNIAQRIYFSDTYHLWRYLQRLLRASALSTGTCAI